ncbi:MAG: extracellular solute-binding protein [Bacteroidetes bacterium]|nr:extracellular solute-binding protein [Bacteroidota bacterium]MBU1116835.1 extracellular solute-binding protein [Bacteroidota bacterium]MBU1799779.1 extracellular solute-binding protein [Bacteroidota bacterium]
MKINYSLILVAILVGVFLLIFSITLLNFGSSEEPEVTKIYYVDNISKTHQKIIDNFNKINEGKIEVIPIDIPFFKFSTNERKELLIRALRGKSERLDIFSADLIWVSRFAKWTENLDKYFTNEEKNKLTPMAISTGLIDNKFLASPLYLDVSVLFYRKDLISKFNNSKEIEKKLHESITWKEFIELGKKYKPQNRFYTFPADAYEGLICSFTELLLTQNKEFFKNGIDFTNSNSEKALTLLVDLVNKYGISPKQVVNYREKDAYFDFVTNNCLSLRGWQSFIHDNKNLEKNSKIEKFITLAQLPHFEGHETGATIGGWNLMLAQNSQHKEEAIKFIKYTLTEEAQKILYSEGAYLPVIKSLYSDSSYCAENPDLKYAKAILDNGELRPKMEDYTKISDILSNYIRAAINNEISVSDALKSAEKEINNTRRIQ